MKKLSMYALLLFWTTTLFVACEDKNDEAIKDDRIPATEFDYSAQQQLRSEAAAMELDNALALALSKNTTLRAGVADTFQVIPDLEAQTIIVDFGAGYKGQDSLVRTGKVTVHYSAWPFAIGTVFTTTSTDYTVAGYTITGSITKTVTGYENYITRATIDENISIEYPRGMGTISRQGTIDRGYIVEQGGNYTISSAGKITVTELSKRKVDYMAKVENPLIYKTLWGETVKGMLTAQVQGDAAIWTIDFGNGTQDGGKLTVYRN